MDTPTSNPNHDMPLDRRKSLSLTENGDQEDTCRICRGEGTTEQPLFYPCKCSGSIRFVHQDCLMTWLSHSQKKYCELCKTSFRFTKLYDQSMPATLPVPLFLRQVGIYTIKTLGRWLRYFLVTLIWTGCLPWSIRQIWRGLFWLADGSWMSAQDLKRLSASGPAPTLLHANSTVNYTERSDANSSVSHYSSITNFDPVAELLNLLTGAPLLRGLLRLLAPKPSSQQGLSSSLNSTSEAFLQSDKSNRQPSLLSDVRALNSMSKYPLLNNGVIDVLEGQLICLSIIAAFILVFLIREWVINQQPILNMPNANQANPQPPPVAQNDEARQAARRRRRGLRRNPDRDQGAENAGWEIRQRPIAIPRPRRAATDDNGLTTHSSGQTPNRQDLPPRSSSFTPVMHDENVSLATREVDEILSIPQNPPDLEDLESPPLQRGMFDEIAGIRRSIEERPSLQERPDGEGSSSQSEDTGFERVDTPSTPSSHQFERIEVNHAQDSDFVFGQQRHSQTVNENSNANFTFTSPFLRTQEPIDSETESESEASDFNRTAFMESDNPWQGATVEVPVTDLETAVETETDSHEDLGNDSENAEDPEYEVVGDADDVPDLDANLEPGTLLGRLGQWMWHTDGIVPEQAHAVGLIEENAAEDAHGGANVLPGGNANAAAPPAPPGNPPAPAHEPNVQFGIDLNDPNAMDDAEDLEGILELIGMEGPLAGIVQNIIFSVFLITLTLSASVWCPYIWGKIAILIASNPLGVFVKAPLYFISKCGNMLVDLILLVCGVSAVVISSLTKMTKAFLMPVLPQVAKIFETTVIENWAMGISQNSGHRLERALSGTFFGLRPDLPTFSMQSHHALRVFGAALSEASTSISADLASTLNSATSHWQSRGVIGVPVFVFTELRSFPKTVLSAANSIAQSWHTFSDDLRMRPLSEIPDVELADMEWTTKDKTIAILVGYVFFALAGFAYLKISHMLYGLRKDEKVDGILADSLRQAGGVLKVIVIIGIEMIVFPLYCGLLLDVALLPLFQEATLQSRLSFMLKTPITCLFIHWFIGTCYMFHFALFVSMCRKIMRKGVLYFIRDPDDPTFHPVRDVLERPVLTQLGKIAFSAMVYGGLVILCLGGVIWTLHGLKGILPIQWATNEPRLAFPLDIHFYNFILPFVLRRVELSKKVSVMFEWWFRRCARALRLSHFLFSEEREDEKLKTSFLWQSKSHEQQLDGRYVRVPAADSVRIPKGTRTFVEVNKDNERIDGEPDHDTGLHGKTNDQFAKIYVPPHFRTRISVFVFLVWLFAASTGVTFTVAPLCIGRTWIHIATGSSLPPNDFYAFTVGIHVCGALFFIGFMIGSRQEQMKFGAADLVKNSKEVFPRLYEAAKYVSGLMYLIIAVFIVLPFSASLITELYIHMPIYSYFADSLSAGSVNGDIEVPNQSSPINPTIFVLQTWTLGLLYVRLALRIILNNAHGQTRAAHAIRAIVRNGYLHPDIALASRAFILPAFTACIVVLAAPLGLARTIILFTGTVDPHDKMQIFRYAYPVVLGMALSAYTAVGVQRKIEGWGVNVRDEIYLRGERLHNFTDPESEKAKKAVRVRVDKGKARVIDGQSLQTTSAVPAPRPTTAERVGDDIATGSGSGNGDRDDRVSLGHEFSAGDDDVVVASGSSLN